MVTLQASESNITLNSNGYNNKQTTTPEYYNITGAATTIVNQRYNFVLYEETEKYMYYLSEDETLYFVYSTFYNDAYILDVSFDPLYYYSNNWAGRVWTEGLQPYPTLTFFPGTTTYPDALYQGFEVKATESSLILNSDGSKNNTITTYSYTDVNLNSRGGPYSLGGYVFNGVTYYNLYTNCTFNQTLSTLSLDTDYLIIFKTGTLAGQTGVLAFITEYNDWEILTITLGLTVGDDFDIVSGQTTQLAQPLTNLKLTDNNFTYKGGLT